MVLVFIQKNTKFNKNSEITLTFGTSSAESLSFKPTLEIGKHQGYVIFEKDTPSYLKKILAIMR